jgi:hypothetical protein
MSNQDHRPRMTTPRRAVITILAAIALILATAGSATVDAFGEQELGDVLGECARHIHDGKIGDHVGLWFGT